MIRYVDFRYARRTDRRVDRVNACTSVARWFSLWYFVLASTQCGMPSAHGLSMPRAQLFRERIFVGFESPERDKHIRRVIFIRAGVGLASPRSRDRWFYTARRVGIVGSIWSGVTILSVLMLMTKLFSFFSPLTCNALAAGRIARGSYSTYQYLSLSACVHGAALSAVQSNNSVRRGLYGLCDGLEQRRTAERIRRKLVTPIPKLC